MWLLVIGSIFLTTYGALAKINHWEFSDKLLNSGMAFSLTSWIVILGDMLKNKIYYKNYWMVSMFIISMFSGILYLITRNKLLRLGTRF